MRLVSIINEVNANLAERRRGCERRRAVASAWPLGSQARPNNTNDHNSKYSNTIDIDSIQ